ncbi:hypothetical protein [Flavobacterium hungaricum]|uniref:Uncharacterized protein n=1 Tax=Flavobacterium hungaricum TaxID=2082725 RepID=A0ABR9TE94_9FLAO|nr:hypothetical protein [Flavobacterium hungaricum]MBE8723677.1 hypothetical protein [Flavobacterium hungaricum]
MEYNYIKSTMIFCIAGFILPAITAILLVLSQIGLQNIGIECTIAWKTFWVLSWIGMIVLPIMFFRYLKGKEEMGNEKLNAYLFFFNFFEYFCIQTALSIFFTTSNTLCHGSDGQNGLELVLTAWMSLPILIIFSYIFKHYTEVTVIK